MERPSTPAAWAALYASRGLSVIPGWRCEPNGTCGCGNVGCEAPGKHPRGDWKQYQIAPADARTVAAWWRRHPNDNVLIVTGAVSGVVVVDIDPRHGGEDALYEFEAAHGILPPSPITLTGGGGQHRWFVHPGVPIRNRTAFLPGLDFRGDGGYVIAEPSWHESGRQYQWDAEADLDTTFPPLPEALERAIRTDSAVHLGAPTKEPFAAILERYMRGQEKIHEGERNSTLTRVAGWYFGQQKPHVDTLAVFGQVFAINSLACTVPLGREEVEAIVSSVGAAEMRRREADAQVVELVEVERMAEVPESDRRELARALWRSVQVEHVDDWFKLVTLSHATFVLELADRTVEMGADLLNKQSQVRSLILNHTSVLIPSMKAPEWARFTQQLVILAREQREGHLRGKDEVADWLEDLQMNAQEYPIERRMSALVSGPIFYQGRVAIRTRNLLYWLEQEGAGQFTSHELGGRLRSGGWEARKIAVSKDGTKQMRVWCSPIVRPWEEAGDDEATP